MIISFDPKIVMKYLDLMESDPFHRYWSWDYCFKEFAEPQTRDIHPITLAFYLASWGMYRGSGGLLQKNHKVHEGAAKIINMPKYKTLHCSENQEVDRKHIPLILELRDAVASHYNAISFVRRGVTKSLSNTDTLLSKILLGTTGCVPAYDRYFLKGLKISKMEDAKFDDDSLRNLFNFLEENQVQIRNCQTTAKKKTKNYYPKMKIVDMYFWQLGYDSELTKKPKRKII